VTALTAIPWESTTSNDRYEIKVTGTPASNHTIQGSFVDNSTEQGNRASLNAGLSLDTTVLVTSQQPEQAVRHQLQRRARLACVRDRPVLAEEVRLPQRGRYRAPHWPTRRSAPAALPSGTTSGQHYHAPFFSALDPEDPRQSAVRG
jgi:hypothetical protein